MQPKPQIVNIPVYQPGKPIEEVKRELGLSEVIKLASNENPFGCSPEALAAIQAEFANISLYPDGSAAELAGKLAERFRINTNQLIFGCGSDEIITLIARAFFLPGDETIMADQTFSVYKSSADIEGVTTIEVPLKEGVHDLEGMLNAVTDKTKIIWICNPNNPTGTLVSAEELASFVERVPEQVMVVLDEAYIEYVDGDKAPDSFGLLAKHRNLVLLRTFSKIYGLASLRIGYGVGDAGVIKLINQVREPFNTSRLAQAAALASLNDDGFIKTCIARNKEGIEFLYEQFDRLGLSYFPANGNFIMVNVGVPAVEMFQALLKLGIIIRAGFGKYPNSIRVTVGSAEQNQKFVGALEQVLKQAQAIG